MRYTCYEPKWTRAGMGQLMAMVWPYCGSVSAFSAAVGGLVAMRRLTNKEAMKPVIRALMAYIDNCGLEMAREFLVHLNSMLDEMTERPKQ